jgi:hypothetical protein
MPTGVYDHSKRRKQFCINGHEIAIVGRDKNSGGGCSECRREYKRVWRKEHKEEMKEQNREYREEHKEEIRAAKQKYNEEHKEEIRRYKQEYSAEKRATDIAFKLTDYLRIRLRLAIKRNQKVGSAIQDLGCTIPFLKDYIAAQFYDSITWDNYGEYWQLDHIKALWRFDLTDREQFLQAVNYKNLQPLTKPDHDKKSSEESAERARLKRSKR